MPKTFYNSHDGDDEVLIFFPRNIEDLIGKHAILVKDEDVISQWKEEYNEKKEAFEIDENKHDTEILTKLIANRRG